MTLQKLGGTFFNDESRGMYFWTAGTRAKSNSAGGVSKNKSKKKTTSKKKSNSSKSQLSKTSLSQAVKSKVAKAQASAPQARKASTPTPRPVQATQTYDFQKPAVSTPVKSTPPKSEAEVGRTGAEQAGVSSMYNIPVAETTTEESKQINEADEAQTAESLMNSPDGLQFSNPEVERVEHQGGFYTSSGEVGVSKGGVAIDPNSAEGKAIQAQYVNQANIQRENVAQQTHFWNQREGNVSMAESLINPRTEQTYVGDNTEFNTQQFLTERGYTNTSQVPDSVFFPQKITVPAQGVITPPENPKVSPEVQKKRESVLAEVERIENPVVLPSSYNSNPLLNDEKKIYDMQGTVSTGQLPPSPIWTVTTKETTTVPTMSGGTQELVAPVTHEFSSAKEADAFANPTKQLTYDEHFGLSNFANTVEDGLVPHPSTTPHIGDNIAYYASTAVRPLVNIVKSGYNLTVAEDEKLTYNETAMGHLIGGTITDVVEGKPFAGTGTTGAYNYFMEDPFRTVTEIPAEVALFVGAGKGIQYGMIGAKNIVTQIGKTGDAIIGGGGRLSQPTMVVMGTASKINQVGVQAGQLPNKAWKTVFNYGDVPHFTINQKPVFTTGQQIVRTTIVNPYKKINYYGSDNVGLGAKISFVATPSGRVFAQQSKDIAGKEFADIQFLNKNLAKFENKEVTGYISRGKLEEVVIDPPKSNAWKFDSAKPSGVQNVKSNIQSMTNDIDALKHTRVGVPDVKSNIDTLKHTRVGVPDVKSPLGKIQKPQVLDDAERTQHITLGIPTGNPKVIKTAIDDITIYSTPQDALIRAPRKAMIEGSIDQSKFKNPITYRDEPHYQTYQTSTSQPVKPQFGKPSIVDGRLVIPRTTGYVDRVPTGTLVKGKANTRFLQDLLKEGDVKLIGKKTVISGKEYFSGGVKHGELRASLNTYNMTSHRSAVGIKTDKHIARDETLIYQSNKPHLPVDKSAFTNTKKGLLFGKESKITEIWKDPLSASKNPPAIPDGIDIRPSSGAPFKGGSPKSDVEITMPSGSGNLVVVVKKVDPLKKVNPLKKVKKYEPQDPTFTKSPYSGYTIGSAIVGETIIHKNAPRIDSASGTKFDVGTKLNTGLKSNQKIDSGLKQETVQNLKTDTIQGLKSNTKQGQKLKTGYKLGTLQTLAITTPLKPITKETPTRRPIALWLPKFTNQNQKRSSGKRSKKVGFIGNVRADSIVGIYSKTDITYGKKKVKKRERIDARITKKEKDRLSGSLALAKPAKKSKKKETSILGMKVTKGILSKDISLGRQKGKSGKSVKPTLL